MKTSLVLFVLLCEVQLRGEVQCCQTHSPAGHALLGQPMKTVPVASTLECLLKCTLNPHCTSVNVKSEASSLLCELNKRTRWTHPDQFRAAERSVYYEVQRDTFDEGQDSLCKAGLTCFAITCKRSAFECRCTSACSLQNSEERLQEAVQVCNHSLGLEDGTLPDNQMTASSSFSQWRKAHKARLNKNGFWSPKTSGSDAWLQIEFKKSTNITAVATQGRGSGYSFVQKYFLEFFQEPGSNWEEYAPGGTRKIFVGNTDSKNVVTQQVKPPFTTRFVRIRSINWSGSIALRVELYGCFV